MLIVIDRTTDGGSDDEEAASLSSSIEGKSNSADYIFFIWNLSHMCYKLVFLSEHLFFLSLLSCGC